VPAKARRKEQVSSTADAFRNPTTSKLRSPNLAPAFRKPLAATGDIRSHSMIPNERNADPYPFHGPREREATAEVVRNLLRAKGFTIYRVAALARARYPHQAAYHIRRNFYSQLRSGLSPTFHQLLALSELTGYRLWDWLAVFGFSPGDIPRLQAVLSRPRTGLGQRPR
jgi:hypothetical protein